MTTTDTVFAGSIPETYERQMVPLFFQGYADDLSSRVAGAGARNVLETAAGTGVLTRALAAKLPAEARIVSTDLNQPMLDFAARVTPPDERITRRQADALALPFDDASFDAVACQFGVMFFPDKVRGFAEARRMLAPGGRFWFNVWGKVEESEFDAVVDETVASLFPHDPPHFMARLPHGYHDAPVIRRDLASAGFGAVTLETKTLTARASSAHDVAVAICQGTPLRSEIEKRDPQRLAEATARAEAALVARFGSGPVEGRMVAHVVSAARDA